MDALDFISKAAKAKPQPLFALVGAEAFLRHLTLEKLTADLLGDADPAFALSAYEGESANWSTVKAELDTLPFLSPRRVVVIEAADPFVTNFRPHLEALVAAEKFSGTLILSLGSLPSNTRLAKLLPAAAVIECKPLKTTAAVAWAKKWLPTRYGKDFAPGAAERLVEFGGDSLGLLDGEMAKLATFAGDAKLVTNDHVASVVGRSREAETFKIFDALGAGDGRKALEILDRLLQSGDDVRRVLGAFSYKLRQLGAISRLVRGGHSEFEAMRAAGVNFGQDETRRLLQHLGRARMDRVYDWLLEVDLGMKGGSELPERIQLERLVARMARPAAARVRK